MAGTLFHCRLLPDGNPASDLRCMSYLYSSHWYSNNCSDADSRSHPRGALQFPSLTLPEPRLEETANHYSDSGNWMMPVDAGTASSLIGIPVRQSGLFFPLARALDLGAVCNALIRHPLIDYRSTVTARSITTDPTRAHLTTHTDTLECDQIVLCTGTGTNDFDQARYLELLPVWGQIDRIRPDNAPVTPIVGEGFMIPIGSDWGVGATYEHKRWTDGIASEFNLQRFDRWWHALTGREVARRVLPAIRGTRAVTSDRMPIVGGLFDQHGARTPRLLVNTGHGSQGTVGAPFAAECIASELIGEFAPGTRAEIDSLSSMRFRTRQARRGPRHGSRA